LHITYELSLYKQIQTENPTPLIGVERGGGAAHSSAELETSCRVAGLPSTEMVTKVLKLSKQNFR